MSPVHLLDRYYLVITALITIAWQLTGFFVAWTSQVRDLSFSSLIQAGEEYHSLIKLQISQEVRLLSLGQWDALRC